MVDLSDCFEIDDEAVYSEWQLFWPAPVFSFVGMNIEPEADCSRCRRGACMQRVDTSDAWKTAHVTHCYDAQQS